MADEASESIRIDAPPEVCFEAAVDFERYPTWAVEIGRVEVLGRDGHGRGLRVRFEVTALGFTIGYILDYDYACAPAEFSWTLHEADLMRALDGSYGFEADGDGTLVTYRLAVDLALPLPGFVKKQAAALITHNAMRGLKRHIEGAS